MADADCYFFVDDAGRGGARTMGVLCVTCRNRAMPGLGWFYEGSREGYGPFEFKCHLCGTVIHAKGDDADQS